MKLYEAIARKIAAINHCAETGNEVWFEEHNKRLEKMLELLPSGSGFDSGVKLLSDESTPEKLVFQADFRHMDENGFYSGWSHHKVIVTSSLQFGFDIKITGKDKNDIKTYIEETMSNILYEDVDE